MTRLEELQNQNRIVQLTEQRAINSGIVAESNLEAQSLGNQKILAPSEKKSQADTLTRVGNTAADVIGNILVGASKGVEGVVDFGANVTALFGDDTYKEKIRKFVENNWTDENITKSEIFQSLTDDSYIKDASETVQNIAYGVSQGVGQMLPAIALAYATGGASTALGASTGTAAALSQAASLGTMMVSAAGSATESAYTEGADYTQATTYGVLVGAVEGATEKMFGGVKATKVTGVFDDVVEKSIGKFANTVGRQNFIKFMADMGEEGIEEMVSEAVEPMLRRATYDQNAENASLEQVIEAGVIGGLTAAFMNGASNVTQNTTKKGRATTALNNAELAISEYNAELQKDNADINKLQNWRNEAEKYFKEAESQMTSITEQNRLKYLQENLISKSAQKRESANYLNKYFNADGTLKDGTYMTANEVENVYNNRVANAKLGINDNLKSENIAERIAKVEGLNLKVEDIVESKDLNEGAKAWMKENNDNYKIPTIVIKDSVFNVSEDPNVKTIEDNMGNALAFYSRNADAIFIKQSAANDFTSFDKNASIEVAAHYIVKGMQNDTSAYGTYGNKNGNKIYTNIANVLEESIKNHDGLADTIADIMVQRGLAQYVDKDGNVINEDIEEWRKKNPDVELSVEAKKDADGNIDWDVYNQEIVDSFIKVIYNGEDNYTLLHHLVNKKQSLIERFMQYIKDTRKGISHKRGEFFKMYRNQLKEIESLLDTAIEYRDEDINTFAQILRDSIDGDDDAEQEDTIEINGEKVPDITKTEVTWKRDGKNILIANLQFRQFDQADIKFITDTLDNTAEFLHKWAKQYGLEDLDKNLLTDIQYSNAKNRDGVARQVLSALVKNGDYPVNFDLSTRCKKRKYFQKVIETMAIQGFFDKYVYNEKDLIAIRKALQENGYEVPCAMCFVENRRLQQGNWAYDIVYKWNEAVRKVKGENFKEQFNFYKMNYEDGTYIDDLDIDTALKQETAETFENAFRKLSNDYKNLNKKGDASSIGNTPETKIAKIVEAFGDDVKLINTADMLTQRGIQNIASKIPNLFALSLSSYGAGTPKNNSGFRAYNSELGLLSNNLIKDIQGDGITGFSKYVTEAKKKYQYENKAKKLGKTVEELTQEEKTKATSTQAKGGEKLTKVQTTKAEKDAMRNYLYDLGGARFQSFSDAQIEEVFDILQLITDCASNDFPLQLYSKEFWEHRMLGQMGVKQNMSLISLIFDNGDDSKVLAGLRRIKSLEDSTSGITIVLETDANGNVVLENEMPKIVERDADGNLINPPEHYAFYETVFADYETHKNANIPEYADGTPIQSHGYKDAIALQMLKAYSKNVGTIAIGFSDAHIIAMLRDKKIRMVIPYHASGMTEGFAKPLKIDSANDYTEVQTAKPKIEDFDELKAKIVSLYPDKVDSIIDNLKKALTLDFKFNKAMQEVKDARAAAEIYKKECYKKKTKFIKKVKVGDVNYEINVNVNYSNIPAFEKFINEENYYKLLADFNCYDAIDESFAQQHGVQVINKETGEIYYPQGLKDSAELIEYVNRLKDQKIFKGDADSVIKALESNSFTANIKSKDDYVKYVSLAMQNMSEILETEVKNKGEMYTALDEKFADVEKGIMDKIAENHKNDEENMPYKIAVAKAQEKAKKKAKKANLLTEEVDTSKKKTNIVSLVNDDGKTIEYETKFNAVKDILSKRFKTNVLNKYKTKDELQKDIRKLASQSSEHYQDAKWQKEYRALIDANLKAQAIDKMLNIARYQEKVSEKSVDLDKKGYDIDDSGISMDGIYDSAQEFLLESKFYRLYKGEIIPNKKTFDLYIKELNTLAKIAQNEVMLKTYMEQKMHQLYVEKRQVWAKKLSVFSKIRTLRDILQRKNNAKALNAKILQNEQFNKALKKFSNSSIFTRINKVTFKDFVDFMIGKDGWFVPSNALLRGVVYNEDGTEIIDYKSLDDSLKWMSDYYFKNTGNGEDTIEYYEHMENILIQSRKLLVSFDERFFRDKKIKIAEEAQNVYDKTQNVIAIGGTHGWVGKTLANIVDPRTLIYALGGYDDNSTIVKLFDGLQKDEVEASVTFYDLTKDLIKYVQDNKYHKHLTKEYLKIEALVDGSTKEIEISYDQAINLYLQASQIESHAGFMTNGFDFVDKKGNTIRVDSYNPYDIIGGTFVNQNGQIEERTGWKFTEADEKYMELLVGAIETKNGKPVLDEYGIPKRSGGMFGALTDLKEEADLKLNGTSNIIRDHFYYPIARIQSEFSKNLANINLNNFTQTLYNLTANKDRNPKASKGIHASSSFENAIQQANLMSKYVKLGVDMDTFGRVAGLSTATNKTRVGVLFDKIVPGTEKYIINLLTDMISPRKSESLQIIGKFRSAWATAQLGGSPKIVASQLASLPTLFNHFSVGTVFKAIKNMMINHKSALAEMNKYSAYGRQRYLDNGIYKAESVNDPNYMLTKFASWFTKPIQWMDQQVILVAWESAKIQAQQSAKINSKEYWEKASSLFENAVRRTQPQYMASERSAMNRSPNEIIKSFTMFSSVSVKYLSMLTQAVQAKIYAIKAKKYYKKTNNTAALAEIEKIEKRIPFVRTLASVATADIMFVLIKRLFDWLYNKDDKDKNGDEISWWEKTMQDLGTTIMGMFPIAKDIYSYFVNGYDIENYSYAMLNDLLASTANVATLINDYANGKDVSQQKVNNAVRTSVYSISNILGLPTRNLTNTITGIISRFDEEFKYEYQNKFYKGTYASDFKEAQEKGDAELANRILDLYLENKGVEASSETSKTIADLYAKGFDNVLPKAVGDSLTYNSETYTLSRAEKQRFKTIYNQAESSVANLTRYDLFKEASDETKTKAIKMVYDYYYTLAVRDYIGDEEYSKIELFANIIPIEKLAAIVAECKSVTSDGTTNGRKIKIMQIINKQRLTNAQKYMILGYLGYSNDQGYSQVLAEIKKSGIDAENQAQLLEYSGYKIA